MAARRLAAEDAAPLKAFDVTGYDGVFEENMTISVESYIGGRGGHEGVKLEEMVRITESGCELVGVYPNIGIAHAVAGTLPLDKFISIQLNISKINIGPFGDRIPPCVIPSCAPSTRSPAKAASPRRRTRSA